MKNRNMGPKKKDRASKMHIADPWALLTWLLVIIALTILLTADTLAPDPETASPAHQTAPLTTEVAV